MGIQGPVVILTRPIWQRASSDRAVPIRVEMWQGTTKDVGRTAAIFADYYLDCGVGELWN